MGHDVRYLGKLTPKKELTEIEIKIFEDLKDDDNYDRLYALEYKDKHFSVDNGNEKIYPSFFFDVVNRYVTILKDGGNDIIDGSYLVSCSEYGIDNESVVMIYRNGSFQTKLITEIIQDWALNIK